MIEIALTQGKITIIDDEDFELISELRWHAVHIRNNFYARASFYDRLTKRMRNIAMHRLLLNADKGIVVDHINRDSLDNRRSNLRLCSIRENSLNQRLRKGSKTGFKGVYFDKDNNKWCASIKSHGKAIHIGTFISPEEAGKAYDLKAKELFGEFAYLNFSENAKARRIPVSFLEKMERESMTSMEIVRSRG